MAGPGLLILAVVGLVMSDKTWVKVLSLLYIIFCVGLVIHEFITEGFDAYYTILLFVLVLVGIIAHGIDSAIDPKPRNRKNS